MLRPVAAWEDVDWLNVCCSRANGASSVANWTDHYYQSQILDYFVSRGNVVKVRWSSLLQIHEQISSDRSGKLTVKICQQWQKMLKNKQATYGTVGRLLVRGKIRLPKVEHPKFEGHMTPNED